MRQLTRLLPVQGSCSVATLKQFPSNRFRCICMAKVGFFAIPTLARRRNRQLGLFDEEGRSSCSNSLGSVSCTTFNILAPIYKRLKAETRESDFRELWISRNENILDRLLELKSSIICLQEFWVGNEELVKLYEDRLGKAGYATYKLARTNNRGDGLLTAVNQDDFCVLDHKECLFNDFGDRVAQLLRVELLFHPKTQLTLDIRKQALVMNTHLIFPHDPRYSFVRLQQVYKMLQFIESYCCEYELAPLPIILCGDWNGSKKGNVYNFLRSQGFISSYSPTCDPSSIDTDEDCTKWVSHRNHRGNLCAVDFIWFLNPNIRRKPLKWSFIEAFLGNVYKLLSKVPNKSASAQASLDYGYSCTYQQFSCALAEIDQDMLGVRGHPQNDLTDEDMKEFWEQRDTDRDGMIDISIFAKEYESEIEELAEVGPETTTSAHAFGFRVSKGVLLPREVGGGIWPDNYSLSDHAYLTVEFNLVQL